MQKSEARAEGKRRRELLSPSERKEYDRVICEKLYERISALTEPGDTVFMYMALDAEVCLDGLIAKLLYEGKRNIAVPRVKGREMKYFIIHSFDELEIGCFNVREPLEICKETEPAESVIIVPGTGFSKDGARAGYGAGYYDRYFAGREGNTLIGAAYFCQTGLDFLPDKYDIIMNEIITEKEY